MKIGRNLARAILEYYRFTNILAIPMFKDVKRKGRPKSHRPQRKFQNIYPSRPKTTRENAPISYTDLSIYYDSDTSADYASPARYPFHSHFMLQHNRLRYFQQQQQDPSCSMTSQKFKDLELSPKAKRKEKPTTSTVSGESTMPLKHQETFTLPTKPYLSIIDFNMLTRGGLEEAVIANKSPEKVCPHHQQKIARPKTADPAKMK
jgi:cytosolic carboxypeptidase protein 6